VWSQWFRQNLPQTWSLFAALLGTGGLVSQAASGGGGLYTLSLPVSRRRLLGVRAATGLSELLVLAFVPSLLLPLLSPGVGQAYALGDALVHSACLFVAGGVVFCATIFLASVFHDIWRPALITLGAALVLSTFEQLLPRSSGAGLFGTMSAEVYFRRGDVPWLGLVLSAAASTALLYAAARNLERRDF
jgi:hypothetical protein